MGGQGGGANSQQARDVVMTSMRRNDVASTSFRRHVPNRFLINQCQIITFLILKYDIIENSRIELRGIVLPVQVDALLGGGGGQRVCCPPPLSNYWGGGSTSFRRHVPNRFLINQCQIITFLILKYDIIEISRIELRGIVFPVQVDALLGWGGGKGYVGPPLKLLGFWPPPPPPAHPTPLPTPMD